MMKYNLPLLMLTLILSLQTLIIAAEPSNNQQPKLNTINTAQEKTANPTPTPKFNKDFARKVIDYKDPNELMQAIIDNKSLGEVQQIIDSGIDINARDSNGNGVRHYVECIYPSNDSLEELLRNNKIDTKTIYNNNNLQPVDIYYNNSFQKLLKGEIKFNATMITEAAKNNPKKKIGPDMPDWPLALSLIFTVIATIWYARWFYIQKTVLEYFFTYSRAIWGFLAIQCIAWALVYIPSFIYGFGNWKFILSIIKNFPSFGSLTMGISIIILIKIILLYYAYQILKMIRLSLKD